MSSLLFFAKKHSSRQIIQSLVISRPDYCNSLLHGLPKYQLARLQHIHNAATRVIACIPHHEHISEIRMQLHWLPIHKRITYKILLLTFLVVNGNSPEYLSELLVLLKPSRVLRSANQPIFTQLHSFIKTFGNRAYVIAAPKLWNSLPTLLRDSHDPNIFKRSLKTYLFKEA